MISTLYIDDLQILPDDGSNIGGLISIDGLGSPSPKKETISRSRAHGEIDLTLYYTGRVLSLVGYIYGPDMPTINTKLDTFKSKLQLGSDHLLKFRRLGMADDEQLAVRVASSVDIGMQSGAVQAIKWSMDLLAPDPRLYTSTERSGSYDPTAGAAGSGFSFPLVFPLVFAGDALTHLELTNQGNFPTPGVFTIEGPVTNPALDNDTTDQTFSTKGLILASGESAIIDMSRKSFSVQGVNRMDFVDSADTVWFDLIPGVNEMRLRGSGMSGGVTTLSATFHDARI